MNSMLKYLDEHPQLMLQWLDESVHIQHLVSSRPNVNDWFIARGYRFEFGIVGDMYILNSIDKTVFGPETGPGADVRLLRTLFKSLVDKLEILA